MSEYLVLLILFSSFSVTVLSSHFSFSATERARYHQWSLLEINVFLYYYFFSCSSFCCIHSNWGFQRIMFTERKFFFVVFVVLNEWSILPFSFIIKINVRKAHYSRWGRWKSAPTQRYDWFFFLSSRFYCGCCSCYGCCWYFLIPMYHIVSRHRSDVESDQSDLLFEMIVCYFIPIRFFIRWPHMKIH